MSAARATAPCFNRRRRALRHTHCLLRERTLSVVDVETTGLSPRDGARVVEVALVRVEPGGEISERFSTLLDAGVGPGPTEVHGITAADLDGAPSWRDIAEAVGERLAGTVLVAHNVGFDYQFIAAEADRAGVPLPDLFTVCTLKAARRWVPELPQRNLAACCDHFGIGLTDAHTALADAEATARLVYALLDIVEPLGKGRMPMLESFSQLVPTASLTTPANIRPRALAA